MRAREGRRLAGARRAGHEHQALGQVAELEDLLGEAHLLGGHDLGRDLAEHAAHPLAVQEEVAAEARQARDLVGEVGVVAALELLAVALGRDRPEDPLRVRGREHRTTGERHDLAVDAQHGRGARADVQVGRVASRPSARTAPPSRRRSRVAAGRATAGRAGAAEGAGATGCFAAAPPGVKVACSRRCAARRGRRPAPRPRSRAAIRLDRPGGGRAPRASAPGPAAGRSTPSSARRPAPRARPRGSRSRPGAPGRAAARCPPALTAACSRRSTDIRTSIPSRA